MPSAPLDRRPKSFPAPEFPPRKPALFARTPPAIFPVILGLLALGLALRAGFAVMGWPAGLVESALGAVSVLWLFAIVALKGKVLRRPTVLLEDLRVLPGRSGLAAATISGMAMASILLPYAPRLALFLLVASMIAHAVMAGLLIHVLAHLPAEARTVTPALHLAFVGFIVGARPLVLLGYSQAAAWVLWLTMPIAAVIWGISLVQLIRRIPPAPLRPLLAIHLAPASLFSAAASLTGYPMLALGFAVFGTAILLALLVSARWIMAAGFSPLWGAFTFPLASYALAMLTLPGGWQSLGMLILVPATGLIPLIAYRVLRLWPGNQLAIKTNAAEA